MVSETEVEKVSDDHLSATLRQLTPSAPLAIVKGWKIVIFLMMFILLIGMQTHVSGVAYFHISRCRSVRPFRRG